MGGKECNQFVQPFLKPVKALTICRQYAVEDKTKNDVDKTQALVQEKLRKMVSVVCEQNMYLFNKYGIPSRGKGMSFRHLLLMTQPYSMRKFHMWKYFDLSLHETIQIFLRTTALFQ